jgi:hypothetical protein
MKDRESEGVVVTGVISILLLTWLGFFLHRSPRFPGSGVGAVFGIAGAVLMLLPLVYTVVKRIPFLYAQVTPHISMQSLMTLHVYAGIVGPLLAIIHTGHKFDSWLGIALTTLMLLVVVSGFVVRYLLTFVANDMKDKLALLQTARGDLDNAWGLIENASTEMSVIKKAPGLMASLASFAIMHPAGELATEVTRIADSVADLEYSVRMHEIFKFWFSWSLKLHIILSIFLYLLLALHIWAGVQYGLRWS